jgi:predicted negative regulator of RcsB-dependent stress response
MLIKIIHLYLIDFTYKKNKMTDTHKHQIENEVDNGAEIIEKAKHFWGKNGKLLTIVLGAFIMIVGGYFVYKQYVQKPNELAAIDKSFKAEEYFRIDSFNLALNGDGVNPGFLKIADKYSNTSTGNLAKFYAGVCYIKLNQNDNAVKFLKDFSTDAKQIQQRAYKLLGDAYGDLGKGDEALDSYKKAAHYFESDQAASAEALFSAAYLAQHVLNKPKDAIDLYKELKEKFPRTQQGNEADKYLAQLGVYNAD